ncbi:MAG: type II toxin-antitoxin system VapB family antitoxin [Deltaproteobacteria bacterium]|nr:type II toxin-antitoxin system VapB family antitoxin [Deltaproteobacteria bacterium]
MSRTNIDLADDLVAEGLSLTKLKTKKELVNYALEELIKRERRKGILEIEGKIEWEGNLDEMRKSRV